MQIYDDRHALHRIPELELELPKTQSYLKKALSGLSCQVFSPFGSALCAWFDFGAQGLKRVGHKQQYNAQV